MQLKDQHLSYQMYRSKYVPFDTIPGTFVLNHMDTIQLIDPISKHAKRLPSDQLHACQATREAYYCDQGIMEHDQGHECINALKSGNSQDTLAHCTLAPAKRTNQLVRLTDSLIYFDQKYPCNTEMCFNHQIHSHWSRDFLHIPKLHPQCTAFHLSQPGQKPICKIVTNHHTNRASSL